MGSCLGPENLVELVRKIAVRKYRSQNEMSLCKSKSEHNITGILSAGASCKPTANSLGLPHRIETDRLGRIIVSPAPRVKPQPPPEQNLSITHLSFWLLAKP